MDSAASTAPPPGTTDLDSSTLLTTHRASCSERSISSHMKSFAPRKMRDAHVRAFVLKYTEGNEKLIKQSCLQCKTLLQGSLQWNVPNTCHSVIIKCAVLMIQHNLHDEIKVKHTQITFQFKHYYVYVETFAFMPNERYMSPHIWIMQFYQLIFD